MTDTLTFTQTIAMPVASVYYAWTNQAALAQWLCDNAQVTLRTGGPIFMEWRQANYYMVGEFTRLEPDHLAFTWQGRGEPGPTGVDVTLSEADGLTTVTVTHGGIGEGEAWETIRSQIRDGWEASLDNLKKVLETGLDERIFGRPFMGIFLGGIVTAEQLAAWGLSHTSGLRITGAMPGTGAEAIGLQDGDVILTLDEEPIVDFGSVGAVLRRHRAGDAIPVAFYRNGHTHTVLLTLGGRPKPQVPESPAALAAAIRQVNSQLAEEMEALLEGVTEAEASLPPAEGEWSVKEILAHLITSLRGWQMAAASIVDGQNLNGWPNNPPVWIHSLSDTYSLDEMVTIFQQSQLESAALAAHLPEDVVSRKTDYITLANFFIQDHPAHTRAHYQEIQAALAAARATVPA